MKRLEDKSTLSRRTSTDLLIQLCQMSIDCGEAIQMKSYADEIQAEIWMGCIHNKLDGPLESYGCIDIDCACHDANSFYFDHLKRSYDKDYGLRHVELVDQSEAVCILQMSNVFVKLIDTLNKFKDDYAASV